MILPPAVDASCRPSKLHIIYKASARKKDKSLANRRQRKKLNYITRELCRGTREWDDEAFVDLPRQLSNWDID